LFLTEDSLEGGFEAGRLHLQSAAARRNQPASGLGWPREWHVRHRLVRSRALLARQDLPASRSRVRKAPFNKVPNGIPGIETRLPLLFSGGVVTGRIDPQTFVALTSTTPARLYGLYPRKGTIAVGSDADLVIWEQGPERTITNAMLHHAVDYTPYEGIAGDRVAGVDAVAR
jgi:hypothetical protein